jgi:hypothetical protein
MEAGIAVFGCGADHLLVASLRIVYYRAPAPVEHCPPEKSGTEQSTAGSRASDEPCRRPRHDEAGNYHGC